MNKNTACLAPSLSPPWMQSLIQIDFISVIELQSFQKKHNLPKPSQNMQNIPEHYPFWLQGAPIPCPGGRLFPNSTHKPGS